MYKVVREVYNCKRCGQEVLWIRGTTRKDMLVRRMCAWCTSYTTYWPRVIRRTIAFIFLIVPNLLGLMFWSLGEIFITGTHWLMDKVGGESPVKDRRPDPKLHKE